jgi:hypothetical protein
MSDLKHAYNPSAQIAVLRALLGQKISELVRMDDYVPGEDYARRGKPLHSYFKLDGGRLRMVMENGLVVGFGSHNEKVCLVVSDQTAIHQNLPSSLHQVSAADMKLSQREMSDLIGEKIVQIDILKEEPRNVREEDRIRETGLVFHTETGKEFYLTYGYHDETDTLSVLFRNEILPEILERTQVIATLTNL